MATRIVKADSSVRILFDKIAHLSEQSKALRFGQRVGNKGRLRNSKTIRRIRNALGKHVPDSGQEHAANGDDDFLVTATSLNTAITYTEFRMVFGFDNGVGDLNKKWFETRTSLGNAG